MGSVRIEINKTEVGKLLRGEGEYVRVKQDLKERAERIAEAAGPGHIVEEGGSQARARVAVVTETDEAKLAESRSRNLTRALEAGR